MFFCFLLPEMGLIINKIFLGNLFIINFQWHWLLKEIYRLLVDNKGFLFNDLYFDLRKKLAINNSIMNWDGNTYLLQN